MRSASTPMPRSSIPLQNIRIEDAFWNPYMKLVTQKILPYQYQVLHDLLPDVPESSCIRNFRIAAGLEEGSVHGWVFQDTDLAKWLEAVAFSLTYEPDPRLEAAADELIRLVGLAQQENGYLNTYFSTLYPGHQYCNLKEGHELYTAGHFIEAAVAYYEATGKTELLSIMCRCADHIIEVFHTEEYSNAVPGHEEIELALVKLARVTGERKYADMAKSFVDRRGCSDYLETEHTLPRYVEVWHDPNPYRNLYGQAHAPVREQTTAEGHAVRALYLYSAMADLAGLYRDEGLRKACEALYENITQKRMYVTGGVGSSGCMERFTTDYDLPNDTAYAESCASIALAMFCRRMASLTGESRYMDTAELALMNTVLAGVSRDGTKFFYVNPLEVVPDFCLEATDKNHVKARRQGWFGCACCPPNIARTLASIGHYAYSTDGADLWLDLYISGTVRAAIGSTPVTVKVTSALPWKGSVQLDISAEDVMEGAVRLRIPGYAEAPRLLLNGKRITPEIIKGYARIPIQGTAARVELEFEMPAKLLYSSTHLAADNGKCALVKGPLVYCLEEADNGRDLSSLWLDTDAPLTEHFDPGLAGGALAVTAQGRQAKAGSDQLYSSKRPTFSPMTLRFVPYFLWGNREPGEMAVWVKYLM